MQKKTFSIASIGIFFILMLLVASLVANSVSANEAVISKTLTLTLALHPTANQIPIFELPAVTKTGQTIISATGVIHYNATKAKGLITFSNGLRRVQVVPAGTILTGKGGISIVTSEEAVIPATPKSLSTHAKVSVTAYSSITGNSGNIPAGDINQACCGHSILAQNLAAFSGGKNARDVTIVTKNDILQATTILQTTLDQQAQDQIQNDLQPGQGLLPYSSCSTDITPDHHPGDQAQQVQVTMREHCVVQAYTLSAIQQQATALLTQSLPRTYKLMRVSILLPDVAVTEDSNGSATLTVHVTAYLQVVRLAHTR